MSTPRPKCPLCNAPGSMVEAFTTPHRYFCNGCARIFVLDLQGRLLEVHETNHEPRRIYVTTKST